MESIKKNSKALFYVLCAIAILVPSVYFALSGKASKVNIQPYSGIGSTSDKELNLTRYNWADEGTFPVKVRDGAILFVGLDPEGRAMMPVNGELNCGDKLVNWKPTVGSLPYSFAVMSDTAVAAEDGTNYKYSWYSPSTRQLRYAFGDDNEYNKLIIATNIAQQNSTGVYKQELTALFDGSAGQTISNMKDKWRGLVTSDKQQQSKQLWRYIAGSNGTGIEDRLYKYLGYTDNMLSNMNDLNKWTDEEMKNGFISYLDLLMTAYSCTNGSSEAQQYWGTCIDRYIAEGTAPNSDASQLVTTIPFNLTIIPGTAVVLPQNPNTGAESMVAVTGCMDIWDYAYQIQTIFDASNPLLADDLSGEKNYGGDGFYNPLARITKANIASLNMEPNEFPVTLKPVYSLLNKCFSQRYNVATGEMEKKSGTIVDSFNTSINRGVDVGVLTGSVNAFALPQTLNMTVNPGNPDVPGMAGGAITGDFKVVWANEDAAYKSISPANSNVGDSVRFRMNFATAPTEEAVWRTISATYKDFRMFIKPKRVYDVAVDVKGGGTETRNKANAERYSPTKGANGIEVKLTNNEFLNLVLGRMPYLQTYDISMLNQSLQLGEMITLGYDLEVEFAWYTDGVEKGRVSTPLAGYSKIEANSDIEREQKAETSPYVLTVYREEEHTNTIVYSTEPTAYAEIKQGTVEMDSNGAIEDYEAMAGVPTTEYLYYASGGSEFVLEFELEYIEGEKGVRWYNSQFSGTECEFKHNDQWKPIEAKGTTDEKNTKEEITILKEKFVAAEDGKDYPEAKEVDAQWYNGYIPGGASSYSVNLVGHDTCDNGTNSISDGYSDDSAPITATWTGLITNPRGTTKETAGSSSHIAGFDKGNVKPTEHGGYIGKPGTFAETDTTWDVTAYHKALYEALNWAKAYEKTNETFTAMKWADSDNYERIWKIGDATIVVSFKDGESNQGAGTRPAGTYNTDNLIEKAKKDGKLANFGYNFGFTAGTPNTTGTCTPASEGPPKVEHSDTTGTDIKPSTVEAVGDITYTIDVTFPKSSNGTNKLTAHELCGTCCTHMLRGLHDTWSQYSQYDYTQFKACRVYKIHRSYVDGMEEITFADYGKENSEEAGNHLMASGPINSYTYFSEAGVKGTWLAKWRDGREVISAKTQAGKHNGTDTIVGAITQGDPNIFYNIALMNNAQDTTNRTASSFGHQGGNTGYSYAFEVRQQKLEREGKEVPDKDLTDWPDKSGIIRSAQNSAAGRIRYSLLPNQLSNVYIVEASQRGNACNTKNYDAGGFIEGVNETLATEPLPSRSNKCDGVGFWALLPNYGSKASQNMFADTTKNPLNPIQVKANGHKKPTVVIKDAKLLGDKASGGLTPNKNVTDIANFSVGCLYADSANNDDSNRFDNTYSDDEFYLQTLTRPDDRTCATVAIEGTAETNGQYQNNDNSVVKNLYNASVDWYDYQSEEYYRFRFRRNQTNKIFVISDMLILQTSTGDQPVMYHWKSQTKRAQQHYDYTSADVEPRMAAVDSFTGTNITLKEDFKNMWYNQRAGDKTKTEDWYTATAMGWGVNNIGQEGQINVGGYTGNYSEPDNKYSNTGLDLVTFNATESHNNGIDKFAEYWTRFPEGFSTVFDHTADTYDPNDLDVFIGHIIAGIDGYGWGAAWPEYLKGAAYLDPTGKEGAFYGCAKENNKGYNAFVEGGPGEGCSSIVQGALGRWHWGAVVDTSARDPYKASPNQRLDAAYHSPNALNNRTGESRMSNVSGLRIVTDMIEQDPTNPNKEYKTGDAYQTYINILDWPKVDDGEMLDGLGKGHKTTPEFNRNEFFETKKAGLAGNIRRQRFFDEDVYKTDEDAKGTVKGLIIDATYSDDHTKVNNIVVQNPISVQNALIVHNEAAEKNGWYSDTRTTDISTFTKETLDDKKDKLEVCPKDDTCEFKVLNCKYFNDITYLSLDFNKDSGAKIDSNGYGTVHNLAYDTEKDTGIKQTMLKDVSLGDFRIVDKITTKIPAKDDPTTPDVNEALDKDKNQIYTYQDIQPFGASNKQFLEAVVEGKGGARLSIPLKNLGVTKETIKSHKFSVEFDLYMDTVYKEDGKTYREPTMLVGFNGLGFYLPKIQNGEHQKNSFTSGNGVEKYTTLFDTYGSSNRIRLEWDFTSEGATKSKLFYNGREITGFNTENNSNPVTTDMIFGSGEGTLNIGCWTKSNEFVSRFYMDNLKVVLKSGTAQHTDACYENETVYESSTMYLCTTPRIWDTKDWATAKPYVWTVPADGKYKLQAWGATGGGWTTDSTKSSHGGLGGYSSGYVSLKKGEQLMIYPGSSGEYTNTGADYEYLWTIDSGCGAGDRYSLENGTMSGGEIINISSLGQSVKYVNSVTGKDSTPIAKGIWSSTNPNPNACVNHSFSVAIYTSGPASGNMVKRLSKSGTSTSIGSITNFSYTGGVQEYTVPADGDYKLEAWGASGGYYGDSQLQMAGEGGYTSGTVHLTKGTKLYVYVGNVGKRDLTTPAPATFNGGGDGGTGMASKDTHLGGSGGGATDFRLVNGAWNAINSLQSRILVAGGGGGAGCASNHNPGHGGGLVGKGTVNLTGTYAGAATDGGSQYNGGGGSGKYTGTRGTGRFGAGANAIQCGAGGGGGYYGGGSEYTAGGSGGSSFVTGYTGCDTTYRNQHRGLVFNNVSMTQGGNVGTGKAKITQLLVDATSRKDYGFTGGVQKFVAPKTGDYTLETWGAQGGGNTVGYESAAGLGGYAKRVVKLNRGDTIYIYVGGQGTLSTALGTGGGWNGGGHGGPGGFGGGGMTHMSTTQNLASAQANGGTNTGSKTFNYTGGIQSFTAPVTGTYNFKLFGATGHGVYDGVGGKGGTTTGNLSLTAGQTIYIGVGGSGIDHGGWNGGQGVQPGGGATHIASTNRGELYNYENFKNEVYLVAGGGGAAERVPGGAGGGTTGGAGSSAYSGLIKAPGGGTQTAGGTYGTSSAYGNGGSGTFGRGGSGTGNGKDTGPTGGAGWYGGGGIPYAGGAGGGSGYVNTSLVTSGSTSTSSGTASGDGQVVVTWNISQSSGTWNPAGTLLVAGGGGGADNTGFSTTVYGGNDDGAGGHGGGTTGGNAKVDGIQRLGTGATQTSGFMQGVGQSVTLSTDTGGAGAGWYGGFVTNHYNGGAGGGSGYAPSGVLMSGTNVGNGRASISWVGSNSANTWAGAGFNGGGSGGAGGYGGGGASDVRKITSGGEFKLGTAKPSTTIETYNGVDYVKVFDHNSTTGGFFTSKAEALSCNKTGKFSLLNQLDTLKGSGKYQFMLYYPETGKRNIWKQSKNPTEEWIPSTDSGSKVSGYEPIQIEMSGNHWGGLALYSQSGTGATLLDGSTGHGNWYYAVGATTKWGTGEKTFPGGNDTSVTRVQLYLACDESLVGGNTKDAVMSESGSITYGPYITAQPGTYQVDIYGDGLADCTFDVYSAQLGGIVYKHDQLLDFKVSPKHVSFYFNLDRPITKASAGLEVRVHHEDSDNYKFEAEYLSRLDDRLIVAGGGGGADDSYSQDAAGGANDGSGGYGGELVAEKAKVNGVYVVPGQALTESGVMAGSKLQGSIDLIKDKTHGTWKALEGINFSGCGLGGGQDYGYALGRGESVSYNTDTGGAGGGYYGGFVTNHSNGGAGGGSNFLSQSLSDTHQEGANNPGQGKVMIQLAEHELSQGNTQLFGFQPVSGLANQIHQGSKRINGKVQEWTVPETGEYKLEVWGASGGDGRLFNTPNVIKGTGGKGGYSSAYVTLTAGTKLYIYVGGQGNDSNERAAGTYGAGGWNGGGDGGTKLGEYDPEHGAGGGGMTHISLSSEDNIEADKFDRNKVIVVAGAGGGGASYAGQKQESSGGEGGGTWGYSYSSYSIPGGQDAKTGSGKAYGKVGYTDNSSANRDGSGGNGAGWYGGGRPDTLPPTDREAGAGGSGYINTNFTTRVNGTVFPLVAGQLLSGRDIQPKPVALTAGVEATGQYVQTGNVGNGAARITKVERGHNADCETEVTQGEKPANVHIHNVDCLLAPSKVNYYYEDEYKVVDGKAPGKTGKLEGAIRQYVSGNHKPLEALLSVTVANKVAGSLSGYVNSNNIDGAVRYIAIYINSIPYDSEAFMCGEYPLNAFDEAKAKKVTQRVLKCVEPHHTGGHYQTDRQAIDATGSADATSCYDPCLNDANHKKTPQGAHVDASTVAGATYINTDEYFDLYFPTTGDFYESKDLGIPYTQQIKGKGYVNNMDTKEWIRERYVKFDFDTLFYRTETGLWEQYSANEWIELPVKNGHDEEVKKHYENDQYEKGDRTVTDGKGNTINTKKEDWYSFYCTLNNNEKGAATITFEAEAINAPNSKGKYYPRDKYPILGSNNIKSQSLSEKFFRYTANDKHPGEVFGNDYKYTRVFDRESLQDKEWVDFPFMVWKENSTGDWYQNTSKNREVIGFKGGKETYLVREQDRYNRVLGPTKDKTADENPATNHRNDNDNKSAVTNEKRKGNLTALHGAHLVQTTDLVGRIGNFMITNTTDVRFVNFFKVAKNDGTYLINGIVKDVYEGLQRNYFSWHLNGVAGNRESLARDVRNRWVGKTVAKDPGFNWLYDTWKTQYWKSARGPANELTYNPSNGARLDTSTPATEPAKGSGTDKMKYGPLSTPISSDKNNLAVYRDKELLKPGYTVNYEITTTGNYASKLQIKPYFYALSLSNKNEYPLGTIVPVDVYMLTDKEYQPINLWGYEDITKDGKQKFPAQGLQIYDYMLSLNWKEEKTQRMITPREDTLSTLVHKTMFENVTNGIPGIDNDEGYFLQPVAIPQGDFFKLGNLQLQRVYNSARTFIGQNLTSYENFVFDLNKETNRDGVDLSDTNFEGKFDLEDYAYRAQRWHLKLGLPSSAVFTVYNGANRIQPTDEVYAKVNGDDITWGKVEDADEGDNTQHKVLGMDVIKNGDYAILMTANIRALGPIWNLYYTQEEHNGTVDIKGKRYSFTTDDFLKITNPENWREDKSNSQVLIAVYNGSDTSSLDVDMIGTH